jgi:hypothetical protein
MLHNARRTLADAIRGEPIRYGSFVPETVDEHADRAPVVHLQISEPLPEGTVVRARLVRGGAPA